MRSKRYDSQFHLRTPRKTPGYAWPPAFKHGSVRTSALNHLKNNGAHRDARTPGAMRTQARFIASPRSSDINAPHFQYFGRFFVGNVCGRTEGESKYSAFTSPPSYQSWAEINYDSRSSCQRIRIT